MQEMTDTEDPVRSFLLLALADGKSQSPQELARAFHASRAKASDAPDAWRRYLSAVNQQALFLARQGALEFLRKGKPILPDEVRGIVRIRKAGTPPA